MISSLPPPPDLSSSSSSASTESTDSSSSANTFHRKIRFAPLPRPPSLECLEDDSSSSSTPVPPSPSPSPSPLPLPPPPLLPHQYQQTFNIPRPSKFSWLKKLLRRLSRGSFSAPPSPRIPYADHTSRPASINSDTSTESATSFFSMRSLPISRWAASMSLLRLPSVLSFSSSTSLSRSQSTPALHNRSTTKVTRRSASSRGSRAKSKGGTRMLNGRVYRGRRARRTDTDPNVNPFANARDEADPVFVEWGYGGMGSVHSAAGDGVWKRVQSSQVALGDYDISVDLSNPADPLGLEESSGMGWVKKRREMREKQPHEAQENHDIGPETAPAAHPKDSEQQRQEKPECNTILPAPPPSEDSPTTPRPQQLVPRSPTDTSEKRHELQAVTVPASAHALQRHLRSNSMTNDAVKTSSAAGSDALQRMSKTPNERHNLQAVAVPAPPHTHRHSQFRTRSNSTNSMHSSPVSGFAMSAVEPSGPQIHQGSVVKSGGVLDLKEFHEMTKSGASKVRRDSKAAEHESESESESDDNDDDDEEDVAITEAGKRPLLALSAGVEKISRHKDKNA